MRKKKYWIGLVMVIFILFAVCFVYWSVGKNQREKPVIQEDTELKKAKEMKEETISLMNPELEITDDMRLQEYHFIRLTDRMNKGDLVDIRISFPNGADFILLARKQIAGIGQEAASGEDPLKSVWLYVTEEELLRLSSAVVDAYLNDGCIIYAISYVDDSQKEAVVNYPVNDIVSQLMKEDPNIIEKAENVLEWKLFRELEAENDVPGNVNLPVDKTTEKNNEKNRENFSETEAGGEIVYYD